jgi:hypothetical protein
MILPGACEYLDEFLAKGFVGWQHSWNDEIGLPVKAVEDEHGLLTTSFIHNTELGKTAMTIVRNRLALKKQASLSIGYRVQGRTKAGLPGYEWVDRAGLSNYLETTKLSPQKKQSIIADYDRLELTELFLIRSYKLYEYSLVTVPANDNAMITDAKRDSLTGLTFDDHSKAVHIAVEAFATRAAEIAALKKSQNRKTIFSAEKQAGITEVIQTLNQSLESLKAVLDTPKAQSDDAMRELAKFELSKARRLGVTA